MTSEQDFNLWTKYGKNIKLLYLSTQNKYSRYPLAVRMVLLLNSDIMPMIEWLMRFADRIHKLKFSKEERR